LSLAGIGCPGHIDVQIAVRVDRKWMHWMIAAQWQATDDDLRRLARHDRAFLERILEDLVIELGIQPALVNADAGSSGAAALHGCPEALIHIGFAAAGGVLQRHQESARMRRVVSKVTSRPGV